MRHTYITLCRTSKHVVAASRAIPITALFCRTLTLSPLQLRISNAFTLGFVVPQSTLQHVNDVLSLDAAHGDLHSRTAIARVLRPMHSQVYESTNPGRIRSCLSKSNRPDSIQLFDAREAINKNISTSALTLPPPPLRNCILACPRVLTA